MLYRKSDEDDENRAEGNGRSRKRTNSKHRLKFAEFRNEEVQNHLPPIDVCVKIYALSNINTRDNTFDADFNVIPDLQGAHAVTFCFLSERHSGSLPLLILEGKIPDPATASTSSFAPFTSSNLSSRLNTTLTPAFNQVMLDWEDPSL